MLGLGTAGGSAAAVSGQASQVHKGAGGGWGGGGGAVYKDSSNDPLGLLGTNAAMQAQERRHHEEVAGLKEKLRWYVVRQYCSNESLYCSTELALN